MNIILIISDTLRYDHIGFNGNPNIHTPFLDRFAEKCVAFDRCYACSFPTGPARADLLMGKWTYTYKKWEPLWDEEVGHIGRKSAPGLLREQGYKDKAVVDTPFFSRRGMGYDKCFLDYEFIRGQADERPDVDAQKRYETDWCAPATMSAAARWLERHYKEKFFMYVDTWDPHEPWAPPPYYVERYYPEFNGERIDPPYAYWKEIGMSEKELQIAHATYCGEVTMVDRWVGYLIDTVEAMGLMDKTAIIFMADHGFYFGEHGIFGKMVFKGRQVLRSPLYEEVAKIPLFVYIPGVEPRREDALVSLPDVTATYLDLGGARIPDSVQGKSLLPIIYGKKKENWDFVITSHPLQHQGEKTRVVDDSERTIQRIWPTTITSKEWSFIYSIEGDPAELYHLPADPQQQKNLIEERKDIAEDLHKKFVARLETAGTNPKLIDVRRKL